MKIVAVLVLLLALTLPVFAQEVTPEATETATPKSPDYCAGTLSYDLPDGWHAGEIAYTRYGASVHIASSKAALDRDGAEKGEAAVVVSAIARSALAQFLDIDADADLGAILEGIASPVSMPVTADSITSIKLGEQTAGRMEVHVNSNDVLFIALDLQPDIVGLVAMVTPAGEMARWQATVIEVAGSLRFDLPGTATIDVRNCSA